MDDPLSRLSFRRDHRWVPGRMSAYLDGELGVRQRARVEHHLNDCRDCHRLFGGLSRVVDALHRLHQPPRAPDATRISEAVRVRLGEP
jgi:anti-sigma factor RsiW